jgi:hypothetical protein
MWFWRTLSCDNAKRSILFIREKLRKWCSFCFDFYVWAVILGMERRKPEMFPSWFNVIWCARRSESKKSGRYLQLLKLQMKIMKGLSFSISYYSFFNHFNGKERKWKQINKVVEKQFFFSWEVMIYMLCFFFFFFYFRQFKIKTSCNRFDFFVKINEMVWVKKNFDKTIRWPWYIFLILFIPKK